MNDPARPTLFQQVLGAAFFNLPESVRRLHAVRGTARYAGSATIQRGSNPLARVCARIAGLPKAMQDVPITVEFATDAMGETWRRDFGGMRMQSRLRFKGGLLRERIGPLQFRHALLANAGVIWWRVEGVRLFGVLPLPTAWFKGVRCRESEQDGRYEFVVEAELLLVGRIIRYEGWLAPA
ncbi:DUF4166 domain-containing protein [Thermomonas sp. HDW16]|uniref:DUF4166 domain-containing protein n=1 Tax=Thermomonas sp. HDW16 TaxID=2714945 RepID=UPI001F0D416C|nr:DUF4166 domain-containing protein [Thermomonas sp. HDW16]